MKKLISIGVALALLTMAVVPAAVAAIEYEPPVTYSKVPFAIVEAGFQLVGSLLETLGPTLGLPEWLDAAMMGDIGGFAGGPLSWTVDMLAWGISLGGDVLGILEPLLGLPEDLDLVGLMDTIACGLLTCWSATNCTGTFSPC